MTQVKPGLRFYSTASMVDVIIVKPADVELQCAGALMVTSAPAERVVGDGAQVELGKRYEDAESGLLVMCTKAGAGPITADGRELQQLTAKPLPSSD